MWRTALASVAAIALTASALAAQQPIDEFIVVNAPRRSLMPLALSPGFTVQQDSAIVEMKTFLSAVARYYRKIGFAEPRLETTAGTVGGQAYVVHLHDYADTLPLGQYEANGMQMELDLSRSLDGGKLTADAIDVLAHELFHAVQRAYRGTSGVDHGDWIIEGQAQAIGMQAALDLRSVDIHTGYYRLGGRQYFRPLATEVHDETYRTASFWRYLAETAAGSGQRGGGSRGAAIEPIQQNYEYMVQLYQVPFDGARGEEDDLLWLDQGLRNVTGNGLAYHYAHFATTFPDYMPTRYVGKFDGTAEEARDSFVARLFAPCPAVHLTATSTSATTRAPLRKNAARCLKVTADAVAATSPTRASNGTAMLRRLRGERGGGTDSSVVLVVETRSPDRSSLEALWLGVVGREETAPAYIGRVRDGYVGDWRFTIPAGKAQDFVISNVADDPTSSLNQDVTLTLYTSAAKMSSAASGVGGPIDLRFRRFPQTEILSTLTEAQQRAGIARPCMIRLSMTTADEEASLALQLDNDGPIEPGTFNVTRSAAPEKSPGQFIGGFGFGTGSERVGYLAEGGTVELTAFSPNLLKGTATLLGRLPKRVYGEKESSWPETMTVRTEFTLVPRVNMGSSLLKQDFCFQPAATP